jgi:ParB-like chromosome segregation protein Spo0J
MRRHQIQSLYTADIHVGDRHRTANAEKVAAIAASMKEIGLQTPISVRIMDDVVIDGDATDGVPVLIAGATRLAAAKSLGWKEIECAVLEASDIEAELWELAENLHRVDLTKDERDRHIRRYAALLESRERDIQSRQSVAYESKRPDRRGHRQEGIASKVAKEIGLSKRTIERALNPPPSKPVKVAADPRNDIEVLESQVAKLMSAWNSASKEAREEFLLRIDQPVFDRTRAA